MALFAAVLTTAWGVDALAGAAAERSARQGAVDAASEAPPVVDVAALQRRLSSLGYRPASRSGRIDGPTRQAVLAFQRANGLASTGEVDAALAARVQAAEAVSRPAWCKSSHALCVDVSTQVGYLRSEGRRYALPVSTGGDFRYTDPRSGKRERATTPRGVYDVWFKAPGHTRAPLGDYYWFSAFKDGFAVHGTKGMQNKPSSHGCVQVPVSIARWVYDALPAGAKVNVRDEPQRSSV